MMKYGILIIVLFFFFLVPLVQGISLSGQKLSPITYRPGITITNHYVISGSDTPIEVVVDKGPFRDITITPVINNEFDLVINFGADEYVPPGSHSFGLTAREVSDFLSEGEGGIGSLTSVSKVFRVEVYSYEKDIRVSLQAANINEGGNVTFQLSVANVGYPNIEKLQGEITVFDQENRELGRVVTPVKPLKSLKGREFKVPFPASNLPVGEYWAKAVVTYDGKQESANTTFLIGNMDIIVNEYTSELQSGFSEFAVKITNNWGNPLRNVYAKIFVNGQELLQTSSINLEAWQKGELKGIMKVDLRPGSYQGRLGLFFEAAAKEVSIFLTVKAPLSENISSTPPMVQEPQSLDLGLWVFFSVIVAGIIVAFLLYKNRGKDEF